MSISKVVRAGSVAVATLGLSTCNDNGAVDPAPPPLDCNADNAKALFADGTLNGQILTITVFPTIGGQWAQQPAVSNVQNASVQGVSPGGEVTLMLASDSVTNGSFDITGTITDGEASCPVKRTFAFTIQNGSVTVARNDLPLGSRERATIVLVRREGHELVLHASGSTAGATIGWTATGGSVEVAADTRARWRLPSEPGLYQIELLVDRGPAGLVLDTLAIEVT